MDKIGKKENLHSGHRKRVKANVVKNGFSQFEDHKLLELILFYSIPQADTNALAHRLLNEFGSFEGIINADFNRLRRVDGVGENTAILLSSISEVYFRTLKVKGRKKPAYTTPEDFKSLALQELSGERKENVIVFCFDSKGKLLKTERISQGDEISATFDVKKIVEAIWNSSSVKAVIAHNHPIGECNPSAGDIDATRNISVTLRRLGFYLVDHIIVDGENNTYSMYSDSMFTRMFY